MNSEIKKFYDYLIENSEFQAKLQKNLKNIHTNEDLKDFIKLEVMPLAKEKNYKFTVDDLIKYEEKSLKNLTSEDLLNVSGGISPKSAILTGDIEQILTCKIF